MIFLCELDGVPVSMEIETRKLRERERERKEEERKKRKSDKAFFFLFFPFDECPHWMNGEGVGWDRISFISSSSFFLLSFKRKEEKKRKTKTKRITRATSEGKVKGPSLPRNRTQVKDLTC